MVSTDTLIVLDRTRNGSNRGVFGGRVAQVKLEEGRLTNY